MEYHKPNFGKLTVLGLLIDNNNLCVLLAVLPLKTQAAFRDRVCITTINPTLVIILK